jgi:hypothetical protein
MKMAVFWVVAPCSLVMMEAAGTSETFSTTPHSVKNQKTAVFKPVLPHIQKVCTLNCVQVVHFEWILFFPVFRRAKNENI